MDIFDKLPKGWALVFFIMGILLFSTIIRFTLCFFKTKAVLQGEADRIIENTKDGAIVYEKTSFTGEPFWEIFRFLFRSNKGDLSIDDYFLSSIVGTTELFIFPILMSISKWEVIGFWIVIKTAGSWGLWSKSRTAYNRFLFGSTMSLSFSYLLFYFFFLK